MRMHAATGFTAIFHAISEAKMHDRSEMLTLLLDRGANVEAVDVKGWRALHMAVLGGKHLMAALLLEGGMNRRGANVNAKQARLGLTPLSAVAGLGYVDMMTLLLVSVHHQLARCACVHHVCVAGIESLLITLPCHTCTIMHVWCRSSPVHVNDHFHARRTPNNVHTPR